MDLAVNLLSTMKNQSLKCSCFAKWEVCQNMFQFAVTAWHTLRTVLVVVSGSFWKLAVSRFQTSIKVTSFPRQHCLNLSWEKFSFLFSITYSPSFSLCNIEMRAEQRKQCHLQAALLDCDCSEIFETIHFFANFFFAVMLLFLFNACQYKKESLVFSVIIIKAEGVAHWHTKLHFIKRSFHHFLCSRSYLH